MGKLKTKIIGIAVIVTMLFGAGQVFAASAIPLPYNTPVTVTWGGSDLYYEFIAPADGTYTLTLSDTDDGDETWACNDVYLNGDHVAHMHDEGSTFTSSMAANDSLVIWVNDGYYAESYVFTVTGDAEVSGSSGSSLSPEQLRTMAVQNFVETLYINVLGRTYDVTGRDYWTSQIMAGGSATAVVKGFIGSQEFIGKNVGNEDFVKILYKVFFNRTASSAEVANWVDALDNGATRAQVISEFAASPEWASRCAYYNINI